MRLNNDMLSQQEIDALLRSGNSETENPQQSLVKLKPIDQDALGEIGNICFGSAATALSTLLNHKVEITTPKVEVLARKSLKYNYPLPHVAVKVAYTDGFYGDNLLALEVKDAGIIADLMLGGSGEVQTEELSELHLSAVSEAMNQMMGSASTAMSTLFHMMVNITPPSVTVMHGEEFSNQGLFEDTEYVVQISFRLIVGTLIDSFLMQIVPLDFAKEMIRKLMGDNWNDELNDGYTANQHPSPVNDIQNLGYAETAAAAAPRDLEERHLSGLSNPTQSSIQSSIPAMGTAQKPDRTQNIQPVKFTNFNSSNAQTHGNSNLDLLLDIPLSVTVELGRAKKQIREILELAPGSILELDKLAGEPVDILVNNKLIAKGEVVVIEENFGVRVTDIISPAERVRKLQ